MINPIHEVETKIAKEPEDKEKEWNSKEIVSIEKIKQLFNNFQVKTSKKLINLYKDGSEMESFFITDFDSNGNKVLFRINGVNKLFEKIRKFYW